MRAPLTFQILLCSSFFGVSAAPVFAADDELATYAKAIDENPNDAKAYEAYATKAINGNPGHFDAAIARLKIGVARIENFPSGYYLLGYSYRKKQAWPEAADYYRRCIALKWKENESYFGLGKSLEGLGDPEGAVAAFKKYVAQEKRPQMQKFLDEANAEIAKLEPAAAAASSGGDVAKLRAEGDSLRNENRFEEAVSTYKRAIAIDPNNLELYNDLGNCFFKLKRFGDAAAAFKATTDRDPKYALGWYNFASALRKADRKSDAVDAYRHYMKLQPDDPDPYYSLGQTLKALGDSGGAVAAFHKYVDMEKRPGEQKWVLKAREELAAMEAAGRSAEKGDSLGKVSDDK